MKSVTPPNHGFILLVDKEGDPVEIFSRNSVIDEVMRRCQVLDGYYIGDAPHSAWRGGGETNSNWGGFFRVSDRVEKK